MFLLRRRVDSFSYHPSSNAVGDVVSNGTSSASATPTHLLRQRQKAAMSNGRTASGLTETEKARISVYLRLFNTVAAILYTVFCVVKDNSFAAVEYIRAKGIRELLYLATAVVVTAGFLTVSLALYASILLYQSFAWLLSDYLLANVSFFTVHPQPPWSPSSRFRRAPSPTGPADAPSSNSAAPDALIDLSSRSSDAGDTPPILAPQVLSPTQLAVRSLSPAFNASMNSDKSAEVEAILNQPTRASPPPAPLSLADILAKRKGTTSLLTTAGNRPIRLREMSTVSYPDINGVDASDEESTSAGQMMDNNTYQSEQDDLPNLYEEEDEEEEDMSFPLPGVEPHEIPISSSPTQLEASLGPEAIEVLDPESRQATLDATSIMAMPEPQPHARTGSESSSTFAWAPPPSRVATLASSTSNDNSTDSPRDIFSPTHVTMPQPQSLNSLSFSLPFLAPSMPQPASVAAVVEKEEQVQEISEKKEDGDGLEPTPYPSPPFTPPSSRPPTMYSSMNLQMPTIGDRNELDFLNDAAVRDKVRLSALVEEAKTELEAVERSMPAPEPAKEEENVVEPETSTNVEEDKEVVDATPLSEPVKAAPVEQEVTTVQEEEEPESVPPAYTEFAAERPTVDAVSVSPPRRMSPVTSIGMGGISTGSRIDVDDLAAPSWEADEEEAPIVDTTTAAAAPQEKTLISSPEEEKLNEVGEVSEVNKEEDAPAPLEMPSIGSIDRSGWGSGADDESTAPKSNLDVRNKKKKKTKSKRPDAKKAVSFDENPFVIGSDKEQGTTVDENDTPDEEEKKQVVKKGRLFELAVNDLSSRAPARAIPSPSVSRAIPVPKTFEVADEEEEEAVPPTLIPRYNSPPPLMEPARSSPVTSPAPSRRVSMLSEVLSPRSTADELSDSSSAVILAPGEYSSKQVDHYARWYVRANRDKSLPTVPMLRTMMKECSEAELAMRLKLGSRAESTKLTKSLVGEEGAGGKGYSSSGGSIPPIRKNSSYRRRR